MRVELLQRQHEKTMARTIRSLLILTAIALSRLPDGRVAVLFEKDGKR
jgi:hypothetical protein